MTNDYLEIELDHDRQKRCGFPEVVYGEDKTAETIVAIFKEQLERETLPFATRISSEKSQLLVETFEEQGVYNATSRTFRFLPDKRKVSFKCSKDSHGTTDDYCPVVGVVTAGTSDLPVAEEAQETLTWMGIQNESIHDIGVAGPHRLIKYADRLSDFDAIVVIAGMEGALPSVVGGYVASPVVAVPTSVGYGASFGGISALLGMLNSCASNVTVVNIDSGFKGGYIAGMIATQAVRTAKKILKSRSMENRCSADEHQKGSLDSNFLS
ncbi:MAG: nickel pincer cofactor biosynthesis protein LarB [Pirellulaceae bacterium]|nr:nickel pincer cofactor biosynthesis protein LarB [Pirellulaceae bacterium]